MKICNYCILFKSIIFNEYLIIYGKYFNFFFLFALINQALYFKNSEQKSVIQNSYSTPHLIFSYSQIFLKFPSFEYERSHQILPFKSYDALRLPMTLTAFHTIYQSSDPAKGWSWINGKELRSRIRKRVCSFLNKEQTFSFVKFVFTRFNLITI